MKRLFTDVQEKAVADFLRIQYMIPGILVRRKHLRYIIRNLWQQYHPEAPLSTKNRVSHHFLRDFCARHKLGFRKPRKKKRSDIKEEEVEQYAREYAEVIAIYPHERILNMDETPLNLLSTKTEVLAEVGTEEVNGQLPGDPKQNFTVICTITASGEKLPPVFLAQGKTPLCHQQFSGISSTEPYEILHSPAGFTNEQVMIDYLRLVNRWMNGRLTVLVLDRYSAHVTTEVKEEAGENEFTPLRHYMFILAEPEKLISYLDPIIKRLSPQSSVSNCLCTMGKYSMCLHTYIQLFDKFQTQIDEKTRVILGKKAENCNIPFGQIMELPVKRVVEYESMINTISRLTPESHPDCEKLNITLKEWHDTIKKCNHELTVFASFNTVHNQRITFSPTARTSSYPSGSKLYWFGEAQVRKLTNVETNLRKLFQQCKDTVFLFIFDSIIWFTSSAQTRGHIVFFSINLADCFIDILSDNIISLYSPDGLFEFALPNQFTFSTIIDMIDDIDKGFSFMETKPRLMKCSFVTEEQNKIETQFMILNCDSKETAIAEFHSLIKDPLKKIRNGKAETADAIAEDREATKDDRDKDNTSEDKRNPDLIGSFTVDRGTGVRDIPVRIEVKKNEEPFVVKVEGIYSVSYK